MVKEKQQDIDNKNKNNQNPQKEQKPIQNKKKIIKKVLFKGNQTNKEDDLKDWKPVKIQKKPNFTPTSTIKQQNLAQTFLSSLSKPIHKPSDKKPIFFDDDQPIKITLKPIINLKKLTPQQIKWDIQDQTFIRKQFIPNKKIQHQLQQEPIQQDQQVILPGNLNKKSQNNPIKMKHIDLSKIVDENWKQDAMRKSTKNQLWEGAQGLLDGRGSLAKLAKQAQQRAQQIQSQLNKRSYQKKQMKNRYGW